jgi:hypothetical protein
MVSPAPSPTRTSSLPTKCAQGRPNGDIYKGLPQMRERNLAFRNTGTAAV